MARILIAEDEESVRLLVARALTQDGHETVTTQDGGEALDTLQREGGRFRSFLLTALKHFLANEWNRAQAQKRGGALKLVSWDELEAENR